MDNFVSLAIALIVLVILIIFRKEISKLISWITSFKKFTKDEKGISFEGYSEPKDLTKSDSKEIKKISNTSKIEEKENASAEVSSFSLYIEEKYQEALDVIEKEKSTKSVKNLVWLESFEGVILFSIDKENAIQHFENLITKYPNDYIPFNWYAISYYWDHYYDDCLKVLERGLEIVDDKSHLITVKVNCLKSMGNDAKAKEMIVAINPRWK